MAHPKRKTSKTRRDKRRTHYKATKPTFMTCSNCSSPVLFHRVCSECGHYKGVKVIETEEDII
ncbi:MAG: 50S ribosomal protein L32 [Bacteroidales bacterium]|nr:50S ribosomal protein L32 [Bacteroidales bacterium]